MISSRNAPQIAIDFNQADGLIFSGRRAAKSSLTGLALVDAHGDGLTLNANNITVRNSHIGLGLDGITGISNGGNGIRISSQSRNNLIGTLEPLTGHPLATQVANVISSNAGSGILIEQSRGNKIANNRIGTSADRTQDIGNGSQGMHITSQAINNTIGGTFNQGNDPTQGQFARPGQGNLISGNGGSGVHIDNKSTKNTLSGNFIGTNSQGTSAISNDGDGVAIINANNNTVHGTTRNEAPFIYYNVVSGNRGNGLRVQNSNSTIIHANFFDQGTSSNAQYGGVIPLGNVNAGNEGNCISVTDQAKGFITFNTFAGLTAFGGIAPNKRSGISISTSGGNTQIRTNMMAGNLLHGLHITGNAKDVWVDPNIIGLDSYGSAATYENHAGARISWANDIDGIRVDGRAQKIRIAGTRRSVIPQNTISNNGGYGIRLLDQARDILIDNTFIGLSSTGKTTFGNAQGGIDAESNIQQLRLGKSRNSQNGICIVGNSGNGITLINPI